MLLYHSNILTWRTTIKVPGSRQDWLQYERPNNWFHVELKAMYVIFGESSQSNGNLSRYNSGSQWVKLQDPSFGGAEKISLSEDLINFTNSDQFRMNDLPIKLVTL